MAIHLSPELEARVRQSAQMHGYASVDAYVSDALIAFQQLAEAEEPQAAEAWKRALAEEAAGDMIDGEEAWKRFYMMRAEFLKTKSAA